MKALCTVVLAAASGRGGVRAAGEARAEGLGAHLHPGLRQRGDVHGDGEPRARVALVGRARPALPAGGEEGAAQGDPRSGRLHDRGHRPRSQGPDSIRAAWRLGATCASLRGRPPAAPSAATRTIPRTSSTWKGGVSCRATVRNDLSISVRRPREPVLRGLADRRARRRRGAGSIWPRRPAVRGSA